MPWKLTETPELYIFTWLGLVGGLLGTVAGILIADYWLDPPHRPRPGRPLPPGRPLLVHRRLELARGRGLRGRRRCWRSAARTRRPGKGPVPRGRPDPVPEAARRLRLGGGARRRRCVLYVVLMLPERGRCGAFGRVRGLRTSGLPGRSCLVGAPRPSPAHQSPAGLIVAPVGRKIQPVRRLRSSQLPGRSSPSGV